jgi:hypothetical protein
MSTEKELNSVQKIYEQGNCREVRCYECPGWDLDCSSINKGGAFWLHCRDLLVKAGRIPACVTEPVHDSYLAPLEARITALENERIEEHEEGNGGEKEPIKIEYSRYKLYLCFKYNNWYILTCNNEGGDARWNSFENGNVSQQTLSSSYDSCQIAIDSVGEGKIKIFDNIKEGLLFFANQK